MVNSFMGLLSKVSFIFILAVYDAAGISFRVFAARFPEREDGQEDADQEVESE
jgi:hypothetical protein